MHLLRKSFSWLFSKEPNNLTRILIAVVPATIAGACSFIAATHSVNNSNYNSQKVAQNTENNQSIDVYAQKSEVLGNSDEENDGLSSFENSNWIFSYNSYPDKEGYYCPNNNAFPSWFMWSKNKYSAEYSAQFSFSLKDRTENEKNPTLYFSYGDKSNNAPDTFYRINVFDGDLNTLRLYDREGNERLFDRSTNIAPLDKFISFSILPRFPNPNSSMLIINPEISYQKKGKPYEFQPNKEFKVELPISSAEQQGDGFHFGIGVSAGDCFKIISTNI